MIRSEFEVYRKAKDELNKSIFELKSINVKEIRDATKRFTSLQQQYTILRTQHSDLEQICEKAREHFAEKKDQSKRIAMVGKESVNIQKKDLAILKVS